MSTIILAAFLSGIPTSFAEPTATLRAESNRPQRAWDKDMAQIQGWIKQQKFTLALNKISELEKRSPHDLRRMELYLLRGDIEAARGRCYNSQNNYHEVLRLRTTEDQKAYERRQHQIANAKIKRCP